MVGALVAGIVAGYVRLLPGVIMVRIDTLISWTLGLLLFAVGVGFGMDRRAVQSLVTMKGKVLLLPLGVVLGSLAATGAVGLVLGRTWNEGAAVGAGFGWYSLSGILIANIHSARLGTLAFLANVMRETLAILILPWVYRQFGVLCAIAPAGATAMDVSLPIIVGEAGEEAGLLAFASGLVLTSLVPILVPLLLR
ncbi:MAG TPA: lysine exporter LysO family protein [bacterium]|jgi:uncharacterized membrane protein YbjE (DUF340 family)|nr:lysine exporter LysO family protein [bacterium]